MSDLVPQRESFVIPVMVLLLWGTATLLPATGQEPSTASRKTLINAIKETKQEIQRVESKIEEEQSETDRTISNLRAKRKEAANQLVQKHQELNRLDRKITDAREKRDRLKNEIDELKRQSSRARELFSILHARLKRWTTRVPPSRHRSRQKQRLKRAKQLAQSDGKTEMAIRKALRVLHSLLKEGRETQLFSTSVITPEGNERKAKVFRAGRMFVAYRLVDGNQYGIRVDGKNGFRWQTDLTDSFKQAIDRAMSRLESEESKADTNPSVVQLPVDPTQEMSAGQSLLSRTFTDRLAAGGPVMIPLALIAVVSVVLILERFWTLRGERSETEHLLSDVRTAVASGDFETAREACEQSTGAVSSVLQTLIDSRDGSDEAIQDRVEEAILQQLPRLERFLPTLNVLAGVAPLLGLLGTVTGIIETFDVIAVFGAGNQKLMAGGISEALMTTATGLVIAIPLLLFHGYFRSRVDAIIGDMERTAATIYNLLEPERTAESDEGSGDGDNDERKDSN